MTAQVSAHELGFEALDALGGMDSLCVFVGEDERPLRGTAGYLDWRMCGAVSRVLVSGFFTGAAGDTLLLPGGRISIPRVFAIGLGKAKALDEPAMEAALASAASVLDRAKVEAVALELPGAGVVAEAARVGALKRVFLPTFAGKRVALLGEKSLGKLL
jgi:leucyl aminopeptidase